MQAILPASTNPGESQSSLIDLVVHPPRTEATVDNQSYRPYGTGRIAYGVPGNKLPGLRRAHSSRYDHLVPLGQSPTAPFGTTNRQYLSTKSTPRRNYGVLE